MRVTQGTFSFLPDFTDEQIDAQIRYALAQRLGDVDRVHRRPASRGTRTGRCGACRCSISRWRRTPTDVLREVRAAARRSRTLHQADRLRPDVHAPDDRARVHRQTARRVEQGFRLDRIQGPRPRDPLSPAPVRNRAARGAALRPQRNGSMTVLEATPPSPTLATGEQEARSATSRTIAEVLRGDERRTRCSTSSTASWSRSHPVKPRIREIAALLLIDRLRRPRSDSRPTGRRCTCRSPATRARARRRSR